jgi:hypothetical protein
MAAARRHVKPQSGPAVADCSAGAPAELARDERIGAP